jgi:class I fructose-bisphosphate aldolase
MHTAAQYRLNRLFNQHSGRLLDVAMDHGLFGEPSFLAGIEDMPRAIATIVSAEPDAIQLSPGLAPVLQDIRGRNKPALVLRVDVANVYGPQLDAYLFSKHYPRAVEMALALDAACIVLNLLQLPDRPDVREQCINGIIAVERECAATGMPLMIEPLVMRPNAAAGGYMVDGDTTKIVTLVRQARELGADLIKADPTDLVDDYHRVVEAASGVPVLVRGGGRVDDVELLRRTRRLLDQGASGIVYGRNIIQHQDPKAIVAALLALLHDDADVEVAAARLKRASS